MRRKHLRNSYLFLLILFVSVGLFSCSAPKNIKYFQDIPDSGALKAIPVAEFVEPTIQIDDILTILVQAVDPQATVSINTGNLPIQNSISAVGAANVAPQISSGYLVNKEGFVDVPVLGHIKLVGLTTAQAKELIYKEAYKYYKDATVIVRFANFKFSVTGEVVKPGVYVSANERTSILDAIALAGDLTIFGKRDNILLIRENLDGSKTPVRINLNKSAVISSPYYYLRQNDLIYVEPNKSKIAATDASQAKLYTIVGAALSVLIVLISRIK
jgi:polysaccharide export outer membrane protein